jgi:hypothetical protein
MSKCHGYRRRVFVECGSDIRIDAITGAARDGLFRPSGIRCALQVALSLVIAIVLGLYTILVLFLTGWIELPNRSLLRQPHHHVCPTIEQPP